MKLQKEIKHVRISFSDKSISKEEFYNFLARLLIKNEEYKTKAT
ncbi:hypothetical protein [Bacillus salipaludis]|uniref:Uncharacterized protein n=1 Tax=Bacillus salipaludis TaxID=2547811 RepID=A0AA90R6N0_9BACI|nr:hypothetical protein [Bacillus salipaludis]MDQ6596481.1 hypothetical protein [Bacillus salipaludis]